jgi:hypothetical protein
MTREILRDNTINTIEKFLESKYFERLCWAVMIFAVVYLGFCFAWSRVVR